jgi:type II secretory pathway predicted ATPase ExeA
MYQNYFGLTEKPFPETPNTKFFYLSPQHREGLAHLEYNILDGKGFTVLVGEVGTGKTTICKALIERLDPEKFTVAHVIHTNLDFHDFLRGVVEELGISSGGLQRWDLLKLLNEHLFEAYGQNRKVVLIIDEAQNLDPSVLEGIRMLSNLETAQEKLIQIVFVGQPGLMEHIQRKDLLQLKQRIAGCFSLGPLSEKETKEYILFRMSAVQSKPSLRFTSEALELIYRKTNGVSRLINFLCDYSIRRAFVAEAWTIEPSLVQKAYEEIKGSTESEGQEELKEGPIESKLPGIRSRGETGISPFTPFQASEGQLLDMDIQGVLLSETSEEENFSFPEKKSKIKKFAVALGLMLILGGLGTVVYWERSLDLMDSKTALPAYQIKMPVSESEKDHSSNLYLSGKKLSKMNREVDNNKN